MVKSLPAMQETRVRSLGREDPLEKEMATQSSTLAWRIPWTEEPSGLPSMESQSRTRLSDWTTTESLLDHTIVFFYFLRALHEVFHKSWTSSHWVAISFSRGSSWPRDWTWVSLIGGRCFNLWATREGSVQIILSFGLRMFVWGLLGQGELKTGLVTHLW